MVIAIGLSWGIEKLRNKRLLWGISLTVGVILSLAVSLSRSNHERVVAVQNRGFDTGSRALFVGALRAGLLETIPDGAILVFDRIPYWLQPELVHAVNSERRFVRVKRIHEIDGVFESGDSLYLAEIKHVRQTIDPSTLDQWLLQLFTIAKDFSAVRIVGFLALVVFDDHIMSSVQKIVNKFTYDTGGLEIRILVLSMTELERAQDK